MEEGEGLCKPGRSRGAKRRNNNPRSENPENDNNQIREPGQNGTESSLHESPHMRQAHRTKR